MAINLNTANTAKTIDVTKQNVVDYLKRRGLLKKNSKAVVDSLAGDGSNNSFLVRSGKLSLAVKQTSNKNKSESHNTYRERMLNEYYSLKVCRLYAPQNIPSLLDVDFNNFIQIIEYRENSVLLQEFLKEHKLPAETAQSITDFLLSIHKKTLNNKVVEMMVGLKGSPELKTRKQYLNASCSWEAKNRITEFVTNEYEKRKICLVLGGFNTRNILINKDRTITAVDFEEAAYSDPAEDAGTILGDLLFFHHSFNTVDKKEIGHIFNSYVQNIGFSQREILKKSIIMHTACIILCRLEKQTDFECCDYFEFTSEKISLKLRELAEKAILNKEKEIQFFFKQK